MTTTMTTIWKDIAGYEGLYQISNTGLVRSLARISVNGHKLKDKLMKTPCNKHGYKVINLRNDGVSTQYQVHRLVAEAFIPRVEGKPTVNHKAIGDTKNNHVDNLEWASAADQMRHAISNGSKRGGQHRMVKLIDKFTGEMKLFKSMSSVSRFLGKCSGWTAINVELYGRIFNFRNYRLEVQS